jgi:hypothetical protein
MNFTMKKTCKNCQLSHLIDSSTKCFGGVVISRKYNMADIPLEPCFKPVTQKECSIYFSSLQGTMSANLEIHRAKLEYLEVSGEVRSTDSLQPNGS